MGQLQSDLDPRATIDAGAVWLRSGIVPRSQRILGAL